MFGSRGKSSDNTGKIDALAIGVRQRAQPLHDPADLEPLLDCVGDARYVLLGEASHGTSEYYTWRSELSKRLIRERGFSFIAVEGDWPDCYRVNRYAKSYPDSGASAREVLHAFERWPTWMWANEEIVELTEWLRRYNGQRRVPDDRKVGFYGLDVYSLWDSMRAVVEYLERIDPQLASGARRAYRCFEPYGEDEQEYARATYLVPTSCEDEAVSVLRALRARSPEYAQDGREAYFNAEQNAFVARNAELYYRTMVRGGSQSWNVRDHHMVDTLDRLMAHHRQVNPDAKAIVWEHNTHVGDARFTNMASAGMVNVGQLVRQAHDDEGVVLVGFGSHHGTVIAGEEWGAPMERMRVPDARRGSWEDVMHDAIAADFDAKAALIVFDDADDGGITGLDEPIDHRAIGVVYDPSHERWGNYVPTIVPRRYDAFMFVDETRALSPLHLPVRVGEVPETFPSGE
ncbi:MAG TPA: erythromycin esterase family protein [Gemmatimonadaceae bacterium]|nr:erythromycin esterase family protein [Gemmatimonadaceae bacterium]